MMGKHSEQIRKMILDIEPLILAHHPLRKINDVINFNFIYEKIKTYFVEKGRPSINPISMIKMLLVLSDFYADAGRH